MKKIDDLLAERQTLENTLAKLTQGTVETYEQEMEIEALERRVQAIDWKIEQAEQADEKPQHKI